MEFGKLPEIQGVDFSFPPDRLFVSEDEPMVIHWALGCPIWNHKELIDRFKEEGDQGRTVLSIYARNFNSIELNSSYYALPSKEKIQKWRDQVPSSFLFFPKAPKDLTFYSQNKFSAKLFDEYLLSLSSFGDQMGESFLQFSPYLTPENKKYLFDLLEALPSDFKFSIELRHQDWFSNPLLLGRLCEYLAKKDINLLVTDTPGRRDVLHMHFPTNRLMVRFKGHNGDRSDYKRLDAWLSFIEKRNCFKKVFFFHHHSNEAYCADTISYMVEKLQWPNVCSAYCRA